MVNKNRHDGTGRKIKNVSRDWTAYIFLLDGTGRRIKTLMTGPDGIEFLLRREVTVLLFFRRHGTVHFFFNDGTGRYAYFFTAQEGGTQKNADLGTKVTSCM